MAPKISQRTFFAIAAVMFLIAVAIRANNVIVFPGMRAPDGYGHFTYIRFLVENGRLPSAEFGWSFFHPPLYYTVMALVWSALDSVDAVLRLKVGTGLMAALGLSHAVASFIIVRRRFPENLPVQLLAPGLMLFLPVLLFGSGYMGNEALNASLAALSILALVMLLDKPVWTRAVILGICLGLGLLTKFTALAMMAGSLASIGLWALAKRRIADGIRLLAIVSVVAISICGWFYVNNVIEYGTPFKMSRDTLMVERVENFQTQGERSLAEYVLFDPMIIMEPHWPRGLPLYGHLPPDTPRSSLRESVWTGIYAGVFFDGVGGQVIPLFSHDLGVLRAGRILLALALVPTFLVLLGICRAIWETLFKGWNGANIAMLTTFAAMMAIFVYGTITVTMHAAVKATYVIPISLIFSYWFALGFDLVSSSWPRVSKLIIAACVLLAIASCVTFTLNRVVGRGYLTDGLQHREWQNLYGVVYYAAGDKEQATQMFDRSAARDWHLGHANAGIVALESGRPLKALGHFGNAARLQKIQSFGLPEDRAAYDAQVQAEYSNSAGVAYYELGRFERAVEAFEKSRELDESIPEAGYNLAATKLAHALALPEELNERREALLAEAKDDLSRSMELDPAFSDAFRLKADVERISGACIHARKTLSSVDEAAVREYPNGTGTGDSHSATVRVRLQVPVPTESVKNALAASRCGEG